MRVRARFAKTGKLRFVSAIDLGRLWERALRKADLPIAYSEGFSPHAKVGFSDALPLGYASTGEYVELVFAAPVDLDRDIARLNHAFPDGLDVRHAVAVEDGAAKMAAGLRASVWDIDYPCAVDVAPLRDAERLLVLRERKGDPIEVDLAPSLHCVHTDPAARGHVRVVLHHVEPPVRPSEVHLALQLSQPDLPEPTLITRVAQGSPVDGGLVEALGGELVSPTPTPIEDRS